MDEDQDEPMIDVTVFKSIKKKVRSSYDLPHRKLYNVQVLDHATSTIPQVLDTLRLSGPFKVRGCVQVSDTIYAKDRKKTTSNKAMVHVKAESVVEWAHEFNPTNPMRPVFWVMSEKVCWYQIQSVHESYKCYFEPLVDVCCYLDAIIHAVFKLDIKDDLAALVPKVAEILDQSESNVKQKLSEYRDRMIDLCASDTELEKRAFYRQWIEEKAAATWNGSLKVIRDTNPIIAMPLQIPADPPLSNSHNTAAWEQRELASLDSPTVAALPKNYDIGCYVDHEEPVVDTFQEPYERLPAPCASDVCPNHPVDLPMEETLSKELETLVWATYFQGGSGWSEADVFDCPLPECLVTVCNSLCSSTQEFIGEVKQHLIQHDLASIEDEALVMDYLAQKRQANAPRPSSSTRPTLNIQLYWTLKAGELQPSPQRAPQNVNIPKNKRLIRRVPQKLESQPEIASTSTSHRTRSSRRNAPALATRAVPDPPMQRTQNRRTTATTTASITSTTSIHMEYLRRPTKEDTRSSSIRAPENADALEEEDSVEVLESGRVSLKLDPPPKQEVHDTGRVLLQFEHAQWGPVKDSRKRETGPLYGSFSHESGNNMQTQRPNPNKRFRSRRSRRVIDSKSPPSRRTSQERDSSSETNEDESGSESQSESSSGTESENWTGSARTHRPNAPRHNVNRLEGRGRNNMRGASEAVSRDRGRGREMQRRGTRSTGSSDESFHTASEDEHRGTESVTDSRSRSRSRSETQSQSQSQSSSGRSSRSSPSRRSRSHSRRESSSDSSSSERGYRVYHDRPRLVLPEQSRGYLRCQFCSRLMFNPARHNCRAIDREEPSIAR